VKAVVVDIIEQLGPKDYGAPGYTYVLNRVTYLNDETLNFCFGAMDTLLSPKKCIPKRRRYTNETEFT
jgi:hypothetical protein